MRSRGWMGTAALRGDAVSENDEENTKWGHLNVCFGPEQILR